MCLLNGWCFAARIFPSRRGASDEHIPQWICKERATKPGAKRTAALWVAPSLACGFVARRSQPHCGGCSLLAPRHRPNWAQQNTSHLGDTTLAQRTVQGGSPPSTVSIPGSHFSWVVVSGTAAQRIAGCRKATVPIGCRRLEATSGATTFSIVRCVAQAGVCFACGNMSWLERISHGL